MKRPLPFLCLPLLALLLLGADTLSAQCSVSITPVADSICVGDSVTLTAAVPNANSLLATMAAGNSHRGNMFDITAINTVTITSFDGNPAGTTNISVYYRPGTFVGFETSSTGWTLLGTANNVVPIGSPTPTPIPVPVNITIPAGQTYAFYVTSTNTAVSLNYSNGTTLGNVYASDANIQFKEGKGMEYPFCNGGSPFSPRVWNGRIHYTIPGTATYAWNTGATTASITVAPTATTAYTVTATSGGTCTASSDVTVGTPTVSLGADSAFCDTTARTLDAGSGYAAYLWSNGATSQTNPGLSGLNWVEVTDAIGCTARDSVSLTYSNGPVVNLGADTLDCSGGPVLLDAGNPGATYAWSNGASTQQASILSTSNVSVLVSDSAGCSSADTIQVLISIASLDLGNDTTLCNAAATILDAGPNWASLLWSNGSTNNFINVNATNLYYVDAIDSLGCTASDSIMVTATSTPFGSFSATGDAGCLQATVNLAPGTATSALWLWGDGNTSSGLNPAPHTYSAPYFGDITVIISNFCGSDTITQPFGCVGMATAPEARVQVVPNPNRGLFQLRIAGLGTDVAAVEIMSLHGQVLLRRDVQAQGGAAVADMDLRDVARGIYLLKLTTPEGVVMQRVVVE